MAKNDLEVLRLALADDGTITVSNRKGYALDVLPTGPMQQQCQYMAEKYFEGDSRESWMVGKFFAPSGSVKKTKLLLVRRANENERW